MKRWQQVLLQGGEGADTTGDMNETKAESGGVGEGVVHLLPPSWPKVVPVVRVPGEGK